MGGKYPRSDDRRVQRTRRTLREALVGLIVERGWDAVSVQDLCERADVGRSTFYTHFADKEELLLGGFEDLRKLLRAASAADAAPGQRFGFARGMIEHVRDHRQLYHAIVGRRSAAAVHRRFREFVIGLFDEDLADLGPAGPERDATVRFVAGAFIELLTWWVETRNSISTQELERLFRRRAAPVVEACRPRAGAEARAAAPSPRSATRRG